MSWHAYKRPDVSLSWTHAVGVMLAPESSPYPSDWAASCSSILSSCAAFHESAYAGVRASWSLHGPIHAPVSVSSLAALGGGEVSANAFFDVARAGVDALSARAGALPAPVARGGAAWRDDDAPTAVVWCVFGAFGCEDMCEADNEKWKRYFVSSSAAPLARDTVFGEDVASFLRSKGATRAGGSRACFRGTQPLAELCGLWAALGIPTRASSAGGDGDAIVDGAAGNEGGAAQVTAVRTVGHGFGVVTVEAWVVPEALGSDIVAYHEAFGHGLNLPHPSSRDDTCVMSHAQYARMPLARAVVCDELKVHCSLLSGAMAAPELFVNLVGLGFARFSSAADASVYLTISEDAALPVPHSSTLFDLLGAVDVIRAGESAGNCGDAAAAASTATPGRAGESGGNCGDAAAAASTATPGAAVHDAPAAPSIVYAFDRSDSSGAPWAVGAERTFFRRAGVSMADDCARRMSVCEVCGCSRRQTTARECASLASVGAASSPISSARAQHAATTVAAPSPSVAAAAIHIPRTPLTAGDWGLSESDAAVDGDRAAEAFDAWRAATADILLDAAARQKLEAAARARADEAAATAASVLDAVCKRVWLETVISRTSAREFTARTVYTFAEMALSGAEGARSLERAGDELSARVCSACLNGSSAAVSAAACAVGALAAPSLFEAPLALTQIADAYARVDKIRAILLHDASRDIIVVLPVGCSAPTLLGMGGVHGAVQPFHAGEWI